MPSVFDTFDLKRAQEIITSRHSTQAETNLKFLGGDHWQGGDAWTGPRPLQADPNFGVKMAAIEAAQITRNVIAELCSRHTSGVLGRELHWGLTPARDLGTVEEIDPDTNETVTKDGEPTDQEQALIGEAEAVLTAWWDKREVPEILQAMLDGALNIKRSPLRLHVPPGLRDAGGNLPSGPLEVVIDYIWLQHLGTNEDTLEQQLPSATVYTDKNSRRDIGIFTYTEDKKEQAELTYLDDLGNTVLRITGGDGDIGQPQLMPLGGRLTLYELTRKWLITPQIISQQKALNKTKTMQGRNDDLGGFLERTYLGVKWPVDVDAAGTETPRPLYVGGGAMNILQPSEYTDADGKVHFANPSVVYRDPVSPATFIASEDATYLSMLQEGQQLHYALAGDAVVSGESRKQARDAFEKDLQYSAGKVEAAARWVLETTLAMASYFAGQAGRFEGLRAYVEARVDSGPISADEERVAIELVDAQLISTESGMSRVGVEDVDAEQSRIDMQQAKKSKRDATMASAALEEARRRFDQEGNGEPMPVPSQNGTGGQLMPNTDFSKEAMETVEIANKLAKTAFGERLRETARTMAETGEILMRAVATRDMSKDKDDGDIVRKWVWDRVSNGRWHTPDIDWLTGELAEMVAKYGGCAMRPMLEIRDHRLSVSVYSLDNKYISQETRDKVKQLDDPSLGDFVEIVDEWEDDSPETWLWYFEDVYPSTHLIFVHYDHFIEVHGIFCETYKDMLDVVHLLRSAMN